MRIALGWLDLSDPADRAVAEPLSAGLKALGHETVLVGPPPAADRGLRAGRREPYVSDLLAQGRRLAPDIWHFHVFGRSHQTLARAAALGRWPFVATLHLVLEDYLPFAGGPKGLWRLLGRARHVTTVSRWSLAEALRVWPRLKGRCSVVPLGAPAPGRRPRPGPGRPRPADRGFVLCAARQAPYKGLDVLLMAFARLRDRGRGLRLMLAGRDQLAGALPRFAEALGVRPYVVFAGEVAPARLRRLLARCLFFVLPSRRENLPMALMEAMAAGRASVASSVGGVPELVRHGREALLVPPGDVRALAAAMERLAADPALRLRLGAAAAKRSAAFDWDRAARRCVGIYERALR